jgi:hypothetical protein
MQKSDIVKVNDQPVGSIFGTLEGREETVVVLPVVIIEHERKVKQLSYGKWGPITCKSESL